MSPRPRLPPSLEMLGGDKGDPRAHARTREARGRLRLSDGGNKDDSAVHTERVVWHCGDLTAKLQLGASGRSLMSEIGFVLLCCVAGPSRTCSNATAAQLKTGAISARERVGAETESPPGVHAPTLRVS